MKTKLRLALMLGLGVALSAPAMAITFTNGDLILGFQATGGTGQFTNVFFNLGSGVYHRDNPGASGNNPFGTTGQTQIGNISTSLTAAFGATWFDRSDVLFGIYGNLNPNPNTGIGNAGQVSGDPSRTTYVSRETATIGGSTLWTGITSNSLGSAGTTFSGMEQMVATLATQSDGAGTVSQGTQPIEWNNGWSVRNPTPGSAFGVFSSGGIQQNFGEGDNVTYIDLQRILATNTGANPTTPTVGRGVIETTFAIGRDGSISAIPEASSSIVALIVGATMTLRRRRRSA